MIIVMFGPERLKAELLELGHQDVHVINDPEGNSFVVLHRFEVPLGRFMGRVIDLALPAPPNYPQGIGAALHILAVPQLFDYNDTVQGVRTITQSSLGLEWRYWSKAFNPSERTTRRLMHHVNEVFEHA